MKIGRPRGLPAANAQLGAIGQYDTANPVHVLHVLRFGSRCFACSVPRNLPTHVREQILIFFRLITEGAFAMRLVRPRFPYLPVVTGILLTLTVGLISRAQTPNPAEQRIERIQGSLVPPVVTKDAPAGPSLADRMSALRVPGVSIAVIHDGKIEWARGFGVTRNGGPSVRPDTLFQAASISKPVTAMAVIRLVQSGKLDLDADVNGYLKTWSLPKNEFTAKQKVTLRELLTHTAGVTVHGFPGYASDAAVPTLVQVLNGEKPANSPAILVDTLPGKEWRYSGGGFVITQLLVQDVTGRQLAVLMRDLVL